MKDKELKLEEIEASRTLGGAVIKLLSFNTCLGNIGDVMLNHKSTSLI
jgi:hypothetical protein